MNNVSFQRIQLPVTVFGV